ncbi:hypothetical protein C8Q74DRAFT_930210 [Fomes fomentarius]|nr:hypothetical protein C8Q74DRAFT_930210 [Fomes fomentarius]
MSRSTSSHAVVDPYYGHGETAKLCSRFVTHLFACPDLPPLSTTVPPAPSPPLADFIAHVLHRTRLQSSITFAALYLLQRLKARFPAARGSSGHRLFISAFMIASKVICDETYSNKSWSIVGQGMFALREINQMEREMCSYLEWQVNLKPSALKEFEQKVRRDFKDLGPYPTYDVPSPAASPMPSTTPYSGQTGASTPTPSFASRTEHPPSTSPPKPIPPPVPVHAGAPPYSATSSPSTADTPDTPEPSTSPALRAPPPSTPVEDHSVRTGTIGTSVNIDSASPTAASHMRAPTSTTSTVAAHVRSVPPILEKKSDEIFARASPCVW